MPRRTFVLLVLLMIAGLLMPSQETKAQTGCLEGGCKVFLPLIHNHVVATATVTSLASPRYCFGIYVGVAVTNVSTEPITRVQLSGKVGATSDSRQYSFAQTTGDVLFPGETNQYGYVVENEHQFCAPDAVASVHVTGALTVPQFHSVDIISRTLVLESLCDGVYTYQVSGIIRNTSTEPITNVRTFLLRNLIQLFIDIDKTTLAPGESAEFTAQYHEYDDLFDGYCDNVPQTISQDSYIVRSWGEAVP